MLQNVTRRYSFLVLAAFLALYSSVCAIEGFSSPPDANQKSAQTKSSSLLESNSQNPAGDWQKFLNEADHLRRQWNAAAWRKAVVLYKRAITHLKRSRMPFEEARALRSLGLVYLALGQTNLAVQNLTSAVALLTKIESASIERVDTLNHLVNAHVMLSQHDKALTLGNENLNASRKLGYLKGEGVALDLLGQVEYATGNLSGSVEFYTAALSVLQKTTDDASVAQTFQDLGYTYSDLNEGSEARRCYEQALVYWRAANNPRGQALTLTALGHLHSKLGEKQRALDLYDQSTQLLEPLEDRIAMGFNLDGLAFIYSGFGENRRALEKYTRKLELFRAARYRYGEIGALWQIGKILILIENYQEALAYLNQSLHLSRSIGDPRMESIPSALIALVHERQNKPALALEAYRRALDLNRKGKDFREEAYTLNSIGRMQEALGLKEEALSNYMQALALNRKAEDRFGESGTLHLLASFEQSRGRLREAKALEEESIALIESLRSGVASHDLRSSYVATVHQQYELYIDILMELHKLDRSAGFDRAALTASEAGRARTLLEALAETKTKIRQGVDPKLLERERAFQLQLEMLSTRQLNALNRGVDKKDSAELQAAIERTTAEYRYVQGQIRARSPNYLALVQPAPLKAEEIQTLLDPATILLEYTLGEKRSFLWVVSSESIVTYELPPRATIERVAEQFYSSLITSTNTKSDSLNDARELSSLLMEGVTIPSQTKRLVIVGDGILQYIPFAAVLEPNRPAVKNSSGDAQPRYLISRYEIVCLPSASVLAVQRTQLANREPAPRAVAVIADPVFDYLDPRVASLRTPRANRRSTQQARIHPTKSPDLSRALRDVGLGIGGRIPRLSFSLAEAEAVYELAPRESSLKATDFKASRETVTSPELSLYKIVHIASHGVLNTKHPELSGIVLSMIDEKGEQVDGFLRLHEIYNLNLPAELVVLSACETGVGKQIRGEGLIALTRGFMYAGAARVVASLWKVDDSATAALMAQFYKEMFTNGKRPAAALQAAQNEIASKKRWRSPYYWAGFVLQGEWK